MRPAVAIFCTLLLALLVPVAVLTERAESYLLSAGPVLNALDSSGIYDQIIPLVVEELLFGPAEDSILGQLPVTPERITEGLTRVFPSAEIKQMVESIATEAYTLTTPGTDLADLNLTIPLAEAKQRLRSETALLLKDIGARETPPLPNCTDEQLLSIAQAADSLSDDDFSFSLFTKEGCWPVTLMGSAKGSFLLDGIPIHPDLIANQLPIEINLTRFLVPQSSESDGRLNFQNATGELSPAELRQLQETEQKIDTLQRRRSYLKTAQAMLWLVSGIIFVILTVASMTTFSRTLWWYGLLALVLGATHLGLGLTGRYILPDALNAKLTDEFEIPPALQETLASVLNTLLNGFFTPLIIGGIVSLLLGIAATLWSRTHGLNNKPEAIN